MIGFLLQCYGIWCFDLFSLFVYEFFFSCVLNSTWSSVLGDSEWFEYWLVCFSDLSGFINDGLCAKLQFFELLDFWVRFLRWACFVSSFGVKSAGGVVSYCTFRSFFSVSTLWVSLSLSLSLSIWIELYLCLLCTFRELGSPCLCLCIFVDFCCWWQYSGRLESWAMDGDWIEAALLNL